MISCTTVGSQRLVICIDQEEGKRGRTNSHSGGAGENHRNWTVVVHCGVTKVLWDAQATFGMNDKDKLNQMRVLKNGQGKTAKANNQQKQWIGVWIFNYHIKKLYW